MTCNFWRLDRRGAFLKLQTSCRALLIAGMHCTHQPQAIIHISRQSGMVAQGGWGAPRSPQRCPPPCRQPSRQAQGAASPGVSRFPITSSGACTRVALCHMGRQHKRAGCCVRTLAKAGQQAAATAAASAAHLPPAPSCCACERIQHTGPASRPAAPTTRSRGQCALAVRPCCGHPAPQQGREAHHALRPRWQAGAGMGASLGASRPLAVASGW